MNKITIKLKNELEIFPTTELELEEGLTVIAGCNGAGKSTLLSDIKLFCKEREQLAVYLDCVTKFQSADLNYVTDFAPETVMMKAWRSEHEHYEGMFAEWVGRVRPSDKFKGKTVFILIDGLDSGGDVTNFQRHLDLFDLMVQDAKERDIHMYLLVTCNNFHYLSQAKSGKVLFSPTFERRVLPAYKDTEYKEYIKDIRRTVRARGFTGR